MAGCFYARTISSPRRASIPQGISSKVFDRGPISPGLFSNWYAFARQLSSPLVRISELRGVKALAAASAVLFVCPL
jgi:hypothetical protein